MICADNTSLQGLPWTEQSRPGLRRASSGATMPAPPTLALTQIVGSLRDGVTLIRRRAP